MVLAKRAAMLTGRFPAACVARFGAARFRMPAVLLEAAVIALAGALAAVASHVAIDIAGDYLLPHDAYDGIVHDSRGLVVVAALLGSFAIAIRVLTAAFDEARGREALFFALVDRIRGRSAWRFAAAVALAAIAGLVAMESLDAALAGERIDDLGDLFGGSIALGLGITIPAAALTAWLCRAALRFVASARRSLVHTIAVALHLAYHRAPVILTQQSRPLRAPRRGLLLARRSGKRAPPFSAR